MKKRIALIGYPAEYFLPFALDLEKGDFAVFWVCALNSDATYLLKNGIQAERVLNLSNFKKDKTPLSVCREILVQFEAAQGPRINDIILMDRVLKNKEWRLAIEYLHHVATQVAQFVDVNGIALLSSWRDTAVQVTTMLVASRLKIPFVVPTRIRIPQEAYGFCTTHHTDSFLSFRDVSPNDLQWAEEFLSSFETRVIKPGLKISSRSFADVARLIPSHTKAFLYECRRSRLDFGNDYSRYTIPRLVSMYLRRRFNLFVYKIACPAVKEVDNNTPFCLYALHTQPESSIDVQASYFSDQIELIRHIARSLPASHLLYVKVHPTDVDGKSLAFYRRIRQIPSVVLVDYTVDTRDFVRRASIVFSVTGTMAYEAALLQKQVVVFAKNFFNALPTVHYCDSPMSLPGLISHLILPGNREASVRQQILGFLAKLRTGCFDGEVSRSWISLRRGLTEADLIELRRAYNVVHDSMRAN